MLNTYSKDESGEPHPESRSEGRGFIVSSSIWNRIGVSNFTLTYKQRHPEFHPVPFQEIHTPSEIQGYHPGDMANYNDLLGVTL